jgi:hypothetical protein
VRVVQRSGSRARAARVDHHLVVGGLGQGVVVPREDKHGVLPAKALGEGPRGREFGGLGLAAEATDQVWRGACMLRSQTR